MQHNNPTVAIKWENQSLIDKAYKTQGPRHNSFQNLDFFTRKYCTLTHSTTIDITRKELAWL